MSSTVIGQDGEYRCSWCAATDEYIDYHDKEWGFPVDDDIRLFEKLCLESFQSGLSWRTILVKRENFRKAFKGFDFKKMAHLGEKDIERLLQDKGIVRHRGKIEAVINNGQKIQEIIKNEGSFAAFVWSFEPDEEKLAIPQTVSTTEESVALSKALKKYGFKFVGPTTVYAFMQAMGLVNDHDENCVIRAKVKLARKRFKKPT